MGTCEKVSGRWWCYSMTEKYSKKCKVSGLKKLSLGKAHETHKRTRHPIAGYVYLELRKERGFWNHEDIAEK